MIGLYFNIGLLAFLSSSLIAVFASIYLSVCVCALNSLYFNLNFADGKFQMGKIVLFFFFLSKRIKRLIWYIGYNHQKFRVFILLSLSFFMFLLVPICIVISIITIDSSVLLKSLNTQRINWIEPKRKRKTRRNCTFLSIYVSKSFQFRFQIFVHSATNRIWLWFFISRWYHI